MSSLQACEWCQHICTFLKDAHACTQTHNSPQNQGCASRTVACSCDLWTAVASSACFLFSPQSSCWFRTMGDANAVGVAHCRMRVCLFLLLGGCRRHKHKQRQQWDGEQPVHSGGCARGDQLAGPVCQGACQTPGYCD